MHTSEFYSISFLFHIFTFGSVLIRIRKARIERGCFTPVCKSGSLHTRHEDVFFCDWIATEEQLITWRNRCKNTHLGQILIQICQTSCGRGQGRPVTTLNTSVNPNASPIPVQRFCGWPKSLTPSGEGTSRGWRWQNWWWNHAETKVKLFAGKTIQKPLSIVRQGQCHLIIYQDPLRDSALAGLFCLCLCQDMIGRRRVTQTTEAENLCRSQLLLFQTSAVIWTPAAAKSTAAKMPKNAARCIRRECSPSACSPFSLVSKCPCASGQFVLNVELISWAAKNVIYLNVDTEEESC